MINDQFQIKNASLIYLILFFRVVIKFNEQLSIIEVTLNLCSLRLESYQLFGQQRSLFFSLREIDQDPPFSKFRLFLISFNKFFLSHFREMGVNILFDQADHQPIRDFLAFFQETLSLFIFKQQFLHLNHMKIISMLQVISQGFLACARTPHQAKSQI